MFSVKGGIIRHFPAQSLDDFRNSDYIFDDDGNVIDSNNLDTEAEKEIEAHTVVVSGNSEEIEKLNLMVGSVIKRVAYTDGNNPFIKITKYLESEGGPHV